MRFTIIIISFLLLHSFAKGQNSGKGWYSEHEKDGVIIQNSYNKGGPYTGPTKEGFNHSYLVYFSRIINETERPMEVKIAFSADSMAIPGSPTTFVKIFLPSDTMTMDKKDLFSYGVTRLASLDQPTSFQRTIKPKEDCLFYTIALFYQTKDVMYEDRGGNRVEYLFNGKNLIFNMLPQIDALECGEIIFDK